MTRSVEKVQAQMAKDVAEQDRFYKSGLAYVLLVLEAEIKRAGSLRKAAKKFRVSPAYLSDVMLQRRAVGPKLLKQIGYTKSREVVTTYQRAK